TGGAGLIGRSGESASADPVSPPAAAAPPRPPLPPRPAAFGLAGTVTVNAAVAREISTACFRITRRSSACAPRRPSLAGKTYAAGPSTFAFRIDRLLLS